jgi:hypothetical protein
VNYLRERLTFHPWAVIPALLYVIGYGPDGALAWPLLLFLYAAVLFLRVLDDYFCFPLDRAQGKTAAYLQAGRARLRPPLLVFGLAVLGAGYAALPSAELMMTVLFIALLLLIYMMLRGRRGMLAVSLLKYPFLLYLAAGLRGDSDGLWPLFGSAFFVGREMLEEIWGFRDQRAELVVVALMVGARCVRVWA